MDGGATDVPILGPMELKNCIAVLFFIILPTCRLQNFLRIENRTTISWDMTTFVQEGQILHKSLENNLKNMFFNFFFNRPTDWKSLKLGKNIWFYNFFLFSTNWLHWSEKNPPSVKSTERGRKNTYLTVLTHVMECADRRMMSQWIGCVSCSRRWFKLKVPCLCEEQLLQSDIRLKVVLGGSPRCPDNHDLSEWHRLYDLGRHTEQP